MPSDVPARRPGKGSKERHPDFDSGTGREVATTHGAYNQVELARRAATVHESLLKYAPWVSEPHYAPSVSRYLEATAREQLAHEALVGKEPGERGFTRLAEVATAAARLSWMMADALGLTPAGHAKLKILVAGGEHAEQSLADLAAEGRRTKGAQAIDTTSEDDEPA